MVLVLGHALAMLPHIPGRLMQGDNDDLMRLVMVRDWLGGQGWYDAHQYRLLPGDGVLMHWSRYVDAGIAAILIPATWVVGVPAAEMLALALWPALLKCLAILVIGLGTQRLLGRAAAVAAVLIFLTWNKFGGEFAPGRIDHHNVQLLCGSALFYLAVLPGRAYLRGALAALVTALSLAVGLEMLPFLLMVWGVMGLRFAFGLDGARDWLLGFGITLGLAAPVLMAGQTPMSDWLINRCDVLAPPVLVLFGIGITATLVAVWLGQRLPGPLVRIAVMLGISGLGLWLAAPLLGPCLAGPYADVTPAARLIIDTRITEARSVPDLLLASPTLVAKVLLSAVLIGVMAGVVAIKMRRRLDPVVWLAVLQALALFVAGLVIAMTQIRATNLLAPVIPFLAGFVVWAFLRLPRQSWLRVPAAVLLVLAMPVTTRAMATWAAGPATAATLGTNTGALASCRTNAAMADLAALPKSVIFSTLDIGAAILAYTDNSATSAPYHRSNAAFWNGIGAFGDEAALRAAVRASGADYLALCRGGGEEAALPYATTLLSGDVPAWLVPSNAQQQAMVIWRVDRAALQTGGPSG